jgi:hypothetical protein
LLRTSSLHKRLAYSWWLGSERDEYGGSRLKAVCFGNRTVLAYCTTDLIRILILFNIGHRAIRPKVPYNHRCFINPNTFGRRC